MTFVRQMIFYIVMLFCGFSFQDFKLTADDDVAATMLQENMDQRSVDVEKDLPKRAPASVSDSGAE